MKNLENILSSYGINQPINTFEPNPVSQKAAVIEAMKKHSLGKDVLGEHKYFDDRQANYLYNRMFDENGSHKPQNIGQAAYGKTHMPFSEPTIKDDIRSMKADVTKTTGKHTAYAGANTGLGMGWQGNRVASRGQLLLNGAVDGTRLVGESGLNALGLMTRQQMLQFKQGGLLSKTMAVAPAALSLYNNATTILDGGDIGDALAMNMSAAVGAAGFHYGKSLTGAMFKGGSVVKAASGASKITGGKMRIASQMVGGVMGGAIATAAASALTYGIKDLTDSESVIAKAARDYSKLNDLASITQTRDTLTMRQKALQQLSQSALNDRGSLLGNEAAILKNLI